MRKKPKLIWSRLFHYQHTFQQLYFAIYCLVFVSVGEDIIISEVFASLISTAAAYLPKIKTNDAKIIIFVKFIVWLVLRIVNFWVNPLAFVVRVVNLLGFPFSLG